MKKNKKRSTKRQKDEFTRLKLASRSQWRVASTSKSRKAHLLASTSPPTRNGELSKSQQRQKHSFTRHGECIYLGGELGRLNSPLMTWHKPTGEETSTRHGE